MTVDLTGLRFSSDQPAPVEFGGTIGSALGGRTDRIDRLGNRWTLPVNTIAMPVEPDGRRWYALLMRAKREGAMLPFPQPGFRIGAPLPAGGTATVATNTASGRSVPLTGLTPAYALRPGQFVSIIHGGQRYLDMVTEQVITDASGLATITLQNLIRTPLTAGDVVEIGRPMIEGWIEGDIAYPRQTNRLTSFSFTIVEKA